MEGKITIKVKTIHPPEYGKPNIDITAESTFEQYDESLAGHILDVCCDAIRLTDPERTIVLLKLLAGKYKPISQESILVERPGKCDDNE